MGSLPSGFPMKTLYVLFFPPHVPHAPPPISALLYFWSTTNHGAHHYAVCTSSSYFVYPRPKVLLQQPIS